MKKFLICILSLSFIFACSGCSKSDNLTEISKDLTCYEINLNVDTENKTVSAKQKVKFINNTNAILKTLKFHLYPQFFTEGATQYIVPSTKMNSAYPNGISCAKFCVDRIKVDDLDENIVLENEFDSILSVELNSSLMPKETSNIVIDFNFELPNIYHRFGFGENTINLANFYPILCVYENNEFNTNPYNANGDPFFSDIANYMVNITVDKQYIVAGTGEKQEEKIENGSKFISFKANAVRDFALVMSNKFNIISETFNDTLIEYFYVVDQNADLSLKAGIDALRTFSNLFGDYPYSTFSIVENDFMHGGMEYPNLIMVSNAIDNKDDYLNVIIHETAHQWWYGIVGNDEYKYPWLDESLTEYSTILFYDYNKGYNFTHKEMINASKENYSLFISVYEDVLGTIDTSMRAVDKYSTEPEYTYCTYVKGVLMFDSLYNLIGKKEFVKCLKTYFENTKYKNAKPEDLITAFSSTTNQNLENFFSSWIKGKVVIR